MDQLPAEVLLHGMAMTTNWNFLHKFSALLFSELSQMLKRRATSPRWFLSPTRSTAEILFILDTPTLDRQTGCGLAVGGSIREEGFAFTSQL